MTVLDWLLSVLQYAVLGSGYLGAVLMVALIVGVLVSGVVKFYVWPALCAFGNWLGRP